MIIKTIIVVLLVLVLTIVVKNKKVYEQFINEYKEEITLPVLAPFALAIIDKLNIYKRFPKLANFVHQKMIILKGSKYSNDFTKIYIAKIITILTLLVFFSLAATIADGTNYTNLFYGLLLTMIIGFYLVKDLDKKVKQRKDSIIIELPEFVNKIILLVNAGETVQGAIKKCVEQNKHNIYESPLYYELNEVVNKMSANTSFQEVMKDLNYRCGIQEVSIFHHHCHDELP